jgi:hypothetical protein
MHTLWEWGNVLQPRCSDGRLNSLTCCCIKRDGQDQQHVNSLAVSQVLRVLGSAGGFAGRLLGFNACPGGLHALVGHPICLDCQCIDSLPT